jgi:hypothetical protein
MAETPPRPICEGWWHHGILWQIFGFLQPINNIEAKLYGNDK